MAEKSGACRARLSGVIRSRIPLQVQHQKTDKYVGSTVLFFIPHLDPAADRLVLGGEQLDPLAFFHGQRCLHWARRSPHSPGSISCYGPACTEYLAMTQW